MKHKKHARNAGEAFSDGFWEESGKNLSDILFESIKLITIEVVLILQVSHVGSVSVKFVPSAQEGDISRSFVVVEIAADSE